MKCQPSEIDKLVELVFRHQGSYVQALGLVERDKVIFSKIYGAPADLENQIPSTDLLFHSASITKPVVATAIMQLAHHRNIDLDCPVRDYLPYFKINGPKSELVSVRMLLNHTSGIPDTDEYGWDKPEFDEQALERSVRNLAKLKLLHVPGEKFTYSNLGYNVLGDVIAKASGLSFERYVEQSVLKPLGMNSSCLSPLRADEALLARPLVLDHDGGIIESTVFPYNRAHAPSSTLLSTLHDLGRFASMLLLRGRVGKKVFLPEPSIESMWRNSVPTGRPDQSAMCLGWFSREYKGHKLIFHGGWDLGFRSFLGLIPEKQIAIICLANFHWAHLGTPFALLDILLDLEPQEMFPAPERLALLVGTYQNEHGDRVKCEFWNGSLKVIDGLTSINLIPQSPSSFAGQSSSESLILQGAAGGTPFLLYRKSKYSRASES